MKRKIMLLAVSFMATIILSCCGNSKDNKADIIEIEKEIDEIIVSIDEHEASLNVLNTPSDTVRKEVKSTSGASSAVMEYEVINPRLSRGNLPVYKIKPAKVNGKYILNIANILFEKGEYTVLIPAAVCNEAQRNKQIEYYGKKLPELEKKLTDKTEIIWGGFVYSQLEELRLGAGTSTIINDDEGVIFSYTDNADETSIYSEAILTGVIGDANYSLHYYKINDEQTLTVEKIFLDSEAQTVIRFPDSQRKNRALLFTNGNNRCDLETAKARAQTLIDDFGTGTMICNEIYDIALSDPFSGDTYVDGYEFEYTIGWNGIEGVNCINRRCIPASGSLGALEDISSVQNKGLDINNVTRQPCVRIKIDSYGVQYISFNEFFDEIRCIESEAQLMSYDKIEQSAVNYMRELLDYAEKNNKGKQWFNADKVELKYALVKYDDVYVMIPVWIYYNHLGDSLYDSVWIAVNAMDGSTIQFFY